MFRSEPLTNEKINQLRQPAANCSADLADRCTWVKPQPVMELWFETVLGMLQFHEIITEEPRTEEDVIQRKCHAVRLQRAKSGATVSYLLTLRLYHISGDDSDRFQLCPESKFGFKWAILTKLEGHLKL